MYRARAPRNPPMREARPPMATHMTTCADRMNPKRSGEVIPAIGA